MAIGIRWHCQELQPLLLCGRMRVPHCGGPRYLRSSTASLIWQRLSSSRNLTGACLVVVLAPVLVLAVVLAVAVVVVAVEAGAC